MIYRVEISSVAETEVDSAFLRLSQIVPPGKARQWHQDLLKKIESLSEMPKRCPLAKENKYFSQEIRQLLYGSSRNTYRILFTVIEEGAVPTVRILHFRYGTQQILGENQESDEA